MSLSGAVEKPEEGNEAAFHGGELLYCGGTIWETMGRKTATAERNLVSPTRLRTLVGVDIRFVASGCGDLPFPFLTIFSSTLIVTSALESFFIV